MEINKESSDGIQERLSRVLLYDLPDQLYFKLLDEVFYKLHEELRLIHIPIFTLQKFNKKNGDKI